MNASQSFQREIQEHGNAIEKLEENVRLVAQQESQAQTAQLVPAKFQLAQLK